MSFATLDAWVSLRTSSSNGELASALVFKFEIQLPIFDMKFVNRSSPQ
jgi:hypothetical protein